MSASRDAAILSGLRASGHTCCDWPEQDCARCAAMRSEMTTERADRQQRARRRAARTPSGWLEQIADRLGLTVRLQHASTGTVYGHFARRDGAEATIRVSDHAECYPPARGIVQWSVAPGELSRRQAAGLLRAWTTEVRP